MTIPSYIVLPLVTITLLIGAMACLPTKQAPEQQPQAQAPKEVYGTACVRNEFSAATWTVIDKGQVTCSKFCAAPFSDANPMVSTTLKDGKGASRVLLDCLCCYLVPTPPAPVPAPQPTPAAK